MNVRLLAALAYPLACVTIAVLTVLLLRLPVRRVFGPGIAYALWILVPLAAMGALLPMPASMPVSLPLPSGLPHWLTSLPAARPDLSPAPQPADMSRWVIAAWLVGVAVLALVQWYQQHAFVRRLGALQRAGTGTWVSDTPDAGPAVVGVFPPKIVVPCDFRQRYTARERALVLAHERMHLRRRDPLANFVVAVVRSVLWFHPLIHLAGRCFRIDQELACDAAVLQRRPHDRPQYAHAILKTQLGGQEVAAGCCLGSRTAASLKRRILMLRTPAPSVRRRLAGVSVVTLASLATAGAAWALQRPATPATPADSATPAASPRTPPAAIETDTITTLTADSIVRTKPTQSVTDLLQTRVPGLTVQQSPAAPGDPARLRLRRASTPRDNDPIVIVDGIRIYNLNGVSPLDQIDSNAIQTIEVVKGPSAISRYGQDAENGAIVITTKRKPQP